MTDEMILVPRAELLAWAKAWLSDYDPNDGTDCVTPFDTYLLKSPAEAPPSAPVGVEGLLADLETIWHSVSDDKETNAAYERLKIALAQQPAAVDAEIEALRAEVAAVWNAMPSGTRYLDPPDGGDVPLHEQVRRMAADAVRAERLAEALRAISELDEREGDSIATARSIARDALRDHDQEGGK